MRKLDVQPQPDKVWSRNRTPIVARRSALMMIDIQNTFCHPEGAMNRAYGILNYASDERMQAYCQRIDQLLIPNTSRLLEFFRCHRLPIVHVVTGAWGPDYHEFPPNFRACILDIEHRTGMSLDYYFGTWDTAIVDQLKPRPSEAIVRKRGSSVFASSDIEWVLKNRGVTSLVFTGVSTGGCVWASAFEGSERGYGIVCVSDATDSTATVEANQEIREKYWGIGQVLTTDHVLSDFRRQLKS